MNATGFIQLSNGCDIITPECEQYVLSQFLSELKSHKVLSTSSPKELQPITAAINVCLNSNSSSGKLNGLLTLEVVIEECNSVLFSQAGPTWIQQLIPLVKPGNASTNFFGRLCQVLRSLIGHAANFSEVSRHLTSAAANLVTALIECVRAAPDAAQHVMPCLLALQVHNFGAVGPVVKTIEKFLIENMNPWNSSLTDVALAKSFAQLPKAGGGGKEGVLHREAWVSLTRRSLNTLDQLVEAIFSILPQRTSSKSAVEKSILDLPKPSNSCDLLRKAFFYSSQFLRLSKCVSQLLSAEFSHTKSIHLAPFFNLADKVLHSFPLWTLAKSQDLESRIIISVLPEICSSTLTIIRNLVNIAQGDLIVFVPQILTLINHVISDLRQCAEAETGTLPFSEVRIQLYNLVATLSNVLSSNSGIEFIAKNLIPLMVADFLPSKAGIKLSTVSVKGGSGNKQKQKSVQSETAIGLPSKATNFDCMVSLAIASLTGLRHILHASGVFLQKSLMKNLQCVLIGLCLEVQRGIEKHSTNVFSSPLVRAHLYKALLEVVISGHPGWPAPTNYAIKIFKQGINGNMETSSKVRSVCRHCLSVCELISHPRSTTLDLELPLDVDEVAATKAETMKVHVVFINHDRAAENGHAFMETPAMPQEEAANTPKESSLVAKTNSPSPTETEVKNHNFDSEPGFDILSGNGKGATKRKITDAPRSEVIDSDDVDIDECERLMKDVNSFDNKASITIPEEVANRSVTALTEKRPRKEDEEGEEADGYDGGLDLETMLSSFVDTTNN